MTADSAASFSRLARWLSRLLGIAALGTLCIGCWAALQAFVDPQSIASMFLGSFPQLTSFQPTQGQVIAIVVALAPQVLLFVWSAYAGWVGFGHVAETSSIDSEAAIWIRRSGLGLALTSLAMLLAHPLLSAIVSLYQPEGQRFITISFGTPELMTLLVSLVMFAFAHLMKLAADIERDNKLII